MLKRFYLHFAAAYGTIWFGLLCIALIWQTKIHLEDSQTFLTVLISFLYATMIIKFYPAKKKQPTAATREKQLAELEAKITQLRFEQSMMNNNAQSK